MNSAARIIYHQHTEVDHGLTHVRHDILHWLDVPDRVTFKLCLSVYKCLHGMGPPYLLEMCQPISSVAGRRHLRPAVRGHLAVPRYRLTTAGRRAFSGWPISMEQSSRVPQKRNAFCSIRTDSASSTLEISQNDSALYKCSLIISRGKNRLHRAVFLRQHGFLVQPTN